MKRYLVLTLCLCALSFAQAQTFNYSGLEIKQEKVKKKNIYEWEQFVMANYAPGFSDMGNTMHSFGLTYGRVKLFGFYLNAMVSTGYHFGYTYESYDAKIDNIYPLYTGKNSNNRASLVFGGIVRMVIPMYLYLGLGYGYQSYTRQLGSGEWAMERRYSTTHSGLLDVGLQGNIKGFTISAGYTMLSGNRRMYHEVKFGIGYTFKAK